MKRFFLYIAIFGLLVGSIIGVWISYQAGILIRPESNWFVAYCIGSCAVTVVSSLILYPVRKLIGEQKFDDAVFNWFMKWMNQIL